jgi:hypothetical protein
MGHHTISNVYFPGLNISNLGVFVLMDTKCSEAYDLVFFIFKQWIGGENIPTKITSDFEIGLINSLEKSFGENKEYIGCYFHFKQALKRKFKDLGFSNTQTEYFLELIGFLTVINEDEISDGFLYFEEKAFQRFPDVNIETLKCFKSYFLSYWLPKYSLWNISRFSVSESLRRTNNCLERYNRYCCISTY